MDENVEAGMVIKYSKKKKLYLCGIVLFFIASVGFIISLSHILVVLLYGKFDFDMPMMYIIFVFSLVLFALSIFVLLSTSNEIILSDANITINRFDIGKSYTVAKKCLLGKQLVAKSTKGKDAYRIDFHLKNKRVISTGIMRGCPETEAREIYEKINCPPILQDTLKNSESYVVAEEDFVVETNYVFLLIAYLPVILPIIGVMFLSIGYMHKHGVPEHFELSGIVLQKNITKSKGYEYYHFTVQEDDSAEEYSIEVGPTIYEEYSDNDRIDIIGKRGYLGILYDIAARHGSQQKTNLKNLQMGRGRKIVNKG
jgi:hypothetical protein